MSDDERSDLDTDAREERREELMFEDHDNGDCDPESCWFCTEESTEF